MQIDSTKKGTNTSFYLGIGTVILAMLSQGNGKRSVELILYTNFFWIIFTTLIGHGVLKKRCSTVQSGEKFYE